MIYTLLKGNLDLENQLEDPEVFMNHLYINDIVVKNLIEEISKTDSDNKIHRIFMDRILEE